MQLIFVHIPKAAGTSLKQAIVARIGETEVAFKYDRPMSDPPLIRRAKCLLARWREPAPTQQVVFGHFLVGKFARLSARGFARRDGLRYATFLRDPLQRAISHYYFWQRTHLAGHKVWERFTREKWSLEQFLLSPEHTNFQSQFLWGFALENFDFVGLAERYEESVRLLGATFPALAGLEVRAANTNPEKAVGSGYAIEPALAMQFRERNAQDYALYAQATALFDQRWHQFMSMEAHAGA